MSADRIQLGNEMVDESLALDSHDSFDDDVVIEPFESSTPVHGHVSSATEPPFADSTITAVMPHDSFDDDVVIEPFESSTSVHRHLSLATDPPFADSIIAAAMPHDSFDDDGIVFETSMVPPVQNNLPLAPEPRSDPEIDHSHNELLEEAAGDDIEYIETHTISNERKQFDRVPKKGGVFGKHGLEGPMPSQCTIQQFFERSPAAGCSRNTLGDTCSVNSKKRKVPIRKLVPKEDISPFVTRTTRLPKSNAFKPVTSAAMRVTVPLVVRDSVDKAPDCGEVTASAVISPATPLMVVDSPARVDTLPDESDSDLSDNEASEAYMVPETVLPTSDSSGEESSSCESSEGEISSLSETSSSSGEPRQRKKAKKTSVTQMPPPLYPTDTAGQQAIVTEFSSICGDVNMSPSAVLRLVGSVHSLCNRKSMSISKLAEIVDKHHYSPKDTELTVPATSTSGRNLLKTVKSQSIRVPGEEIEELDFSQLSQLRHEYRARAMETPTRLSSDFVADACDCDIPPEIPVMEGYRLIPLTSRTHAAQWAGATRMILVLHGTTHHSKKYIVAWHKGHTRNARNLRYESVNSTTFNTLYQTDDGDKFENLFVRHRNTSAGGVHSKKYFVRCPDRNYSTHVFGIIKVNSDNYE